MNRPLRIAISAVALAAVLSVLVPLSVRSGRERAEITCDSLDVKIHDARRKGFVTQADVTQAIASGYGQCRGRKLESINLATIEEICSNLSAVEKSQAYVTRDGVLHIDIEQRDPVLKFITPDGGYYADGKGFIFPLVKGYDDRLTAIEGPNPLSIPPGYKGLPGSERERSWLEGLLELNDALGSSRTWKGAFSRIQSDAGGELTLHPVKGKEKFLFGKPSEIEDKLRRVEDYYRYIVPEKEEGWYRTVNVKYDGQIVCRR